MLSLANYDHLNVVPLHEVKKKPKMVERILMTIVRKHDQKGLPIEEIESQFKRLIRGTFEQLEVGPLVSFISLRNELFQLDDKNYLKCSEKAKNIYLDLRDINAESGIIAPSYFKTAIENGFVKKDGLMMSRPQKSGKENVSRGPPIIIDLT